MLLLSVTINHQLANPATERLHQDGERMMVLETHNTTPANMLTGNIVFLLGPLNATTTD